MCLVVLYFTSYLDTWQEWKPESSRTSIHSNWPHLSKVQWILAVISAGLEGFFWLGVSTGRRLFNWTTLFKPTCACVDCVFTTSRLLEVKFSVVSDLVNHWILKKDVLQTRHVCSFVLIATAAVIVVVVVLLYCLFTQTHPPTLLLALSCWWSHFVWQPRCFWSEFCMFPSQRGSQHLHLFLLFSAAVHPCVFSLSSKVFFGVSLTYHYCEAWEKLIIPKLPHLLGPDLGPEPGSVTEH